MRNHSHCRLQIADRRCMRSVGGELRTGCCEPRSRTIAYGVRGYEPEAEPNFEYRTPNFEVEVPGPNVELLRKAYEGTYVRRQPRMPNSECGIPVTLGSEEATLWFKVRRSTRDVSKSRESGNRRIGGTGKRGANRIRNTQGDPISECGLRTVGRDVSTFVTLHQRNKGGPLR